jgi:hypothetical protein
MTTKLEDDRFGGEFLEEIIEWVASNLNPEDVFDHDALEEWALDNGFEEQQSRL